MSDEQRRAGREEPEVEGHMRRGVHDEPAEDGEENEVEAHVRRANVRMDSPRKL
jgi:hypothetical protein